MLIKLQGLHVQICASLDRMDALTREPAAPMDQLLAVRLELTRASRSRSLLLERMYDELIAAAAPAIGREIESLRAEGRANLIASVDHIGSWTPCRVAHNWPEYCAASNKMRSAMRLRIKDEARLIYPLLSKLARRATAA